ncbi:hypothetical protein ACFQ0F_05040 [Paraperlucidibaca wandonensis]|jgi:hypothetical protein|uniref:Uncharacterized protein n=1 Tax=Paraperlucidibaca wandonensis TaxID=1268273 RepID=A0ABW3HEX0_9GAMM|tara:strand:+ start:205 stop:507 length:303 start_codon:yes stop_codon:yes gene_type:complete
MIFIAMLFTAVLSSALTLWVARWWLMNQGQATWSREIDALHESLARTVEIRVKRAMIESLAETRQDEDLRETTWKAARSGGELINESMKSWLKRRKVPSE